MPDDRKVFDIARPTATATARPVIPSGPPAADPMVKAPASAPSPTRSIPLTFAGEEEEEAASTAVPVVETAKPAPEAPQSEPQIAAPVVEPSLAEEPKPQVSNIPVSEAPDEPPTVQAAPAVEQPASAITPALPGAPEPSFAAVPKFGEMQAKIDAHPLFSGHKEKRVKVRRVPRFFWPLFVLLVLAALAYLAIDAGLVRGASHLPYHFFKQDKPVAAAPAITAPQSKTPATTPAPTAPATVTKFTTWQKYTSTATGYTFSYPADYGPLAIQSVSDKNVAGFMQTAEPKVGLANVSGSFSVTDYKTATAAIPTYKNGPTIELQGAKWIVATASSSDFNQYKVGQTFKDISAVKNSQGQNVYTMVSSNNGETSYVIVFVSGGSLHTITFPAFTVARIGAIGSNDQTYYDAMYRQVRSSITVKP